MMSMDDQDTFRMQAGLGAYGPPPSRILKSGNTQTYETNIDSETSAVTSAIHHPISYESSLGTLATVTNFQFRKFNSDLTAVRQIEQVKK